MSVIQTTKKLLITLTFLVALVLAYVQWPEEEKNGFQLVVPIVNPIPLWQHQVISANSTAAAHAPFIISKPDGNQLAFWFGGTKEGHRDVQLYRVLLSEGGVDSAPEAVLSPQQLSDLSHRFIKMLGNPVLWYNGDQLVLSIVNVTAGGWATSRVDLLTSEDEGQTFEYQRTLRTSPFFNISTLVRNGPVRLENGFLLPAYFELNRFNPQLLSLNAKLELTGVRTPSLEGIQPALMPYDSAMVSMLLRPHAKGPVPGGHFNIETGTTSEITINPELINPSSAFDIIRISEYHWLMAHNAGLTRNLLLLSISTDNGQSWQVVKTIEQGDASYAYPSLAVDEQGVIHMVYSESKRQIHYVRFTLAEWLLEESR